MRAETSMLPSRSRWPRSVSTMRRPGRRPTGRRSWHRTRPSCRSCSIARCCSPPTSRRSMRWLSAGQAWHHGGADLLVEPEGPCRRRLRRARGHCLVAGCDRRGDGVCQRRGARQRDAVRSHRHPRVPGLRRDDAARRLAQRSARASGRPTSPCMSCCPSSTAASLPAPSVSRPNATPTPRWPSAASTPGPSRIGSSRWRRGSPQ